MSKINEAVGEKSLLDKFGGKKLFVCPFRRQEFCKFIECILLEFTYGNKLHKLWGGNPIYFGKKEQTKLHRDICRNTYLHRVRCDIYCPRYC